MSSQTVSATVTLRLQIPRSVLDPFIDAEDQDQTWYETSNEAIREEVGQVLDRVIAEELPSFLDHCVSEEAEVDW